MSVDIRPMSGISLANFETFAERFDFALYKTMCNVGGATGQLSIFLARRHLHLTCRTCDLPPVERQPVSVADGLPDYPLIRADRWPRALNSARRMSHGGNTTTASRDLRSRLNA